MRPGKVTQAKRNRERAQQQKRQEKQARRAQRTLEKTQRVPANEMADGEDPQLAGLRPGPQPPLF